MNLLNLLPSELRTLNDTIVDPSVEMEFMDQLATMLYDDVRPDCHDMAILDKYVSTGHELRSQPNIRDVLAPLTYEHNNATRAFFEGIFP